MCETVGVNFDGDLCNNCDHVYHGILNVISQYGGSVSDRPTRNLTARQAIDYMNKQSDLTV
jgi:hypothetical protein